MSFADYAIAFRLYITVAPYASPAESVNQRGAAAECRGDAAEKKRKKRVRKKRKAYEADAKTYIHEHAADAEDMLIR
jgi:hypothetical protein